MSADSISECPGCHEEEMREWYEYKLSDESFFFSYYAKCKGCQFEFQRQYEEAAFGWAEDRRDWVIQPHWTESACGSNDE